MDIAQIDIIAGWVSLVLTLMVFSYLLADNFLYRIAVHMLVGAAAGFVVFAAIREVVMPWTESMILLPDGSGDVVLQKRLAGIVPYLFVALLLLKSTKRFPRIGNLGSAVIIGVGTAVALVGIVGATIIALINDTGDSVAEADGLDGFIMVIGTVCTLAYFQYVSWRNRDGSPRRPLPMQLMATVGQGFIAVTLGALYAGAILTSLTIFSAVLHEQISFVVEQLGG